MFSVEHLKKRTWQLGVCKMIPLVEQLPLNVNVLYVYVLLLQQNTDIVIFDTF